MAILPADFLNSAEVASASSHSQEVDLRNAVSRAYYAVYHTAEGVLARKQLPRYADGGSHQALVDSIKAVDRSLAYQIQSLHRARVTADYLIDEEFAQQEVQLHLATAKRLIERLDQL